ncbi:MAG: efflux RND transporter periplasmic adaptor subunit [Campylobacterales bacterium]|nr:efflux RND transporter periplasmic adaptor subunit [Campylobacterales bacterium]
MKTLITVLLITLGLSAQPLLLTQEQERNAGVKTERVKEQSDLFLGEMMGSVEIPARLLHSVSIPFEVKIVRLLGEQYATLKAGDLLAEVVGSDFINAQQHLIERAIEWERSGQEHERKSQLCLEGVIAAKECVYSESERQSAEAQFKSARSMLMLFGVDEAFVAQALKSKTVQSRFGVRAPVAGILSEIHVRLGQSVEASSPLFTVMQKGDLWLSARLEHGVAQALHVGDEVLIEHEESALRSRVLSIAPFVESATQTVEVRFDLGASSTIRAGLKAPFRLSIARTVVRIPKAWTVLMGSRVLLFVRSDEGYTPQNLKVLGEDDEAYYSDDLTLASKQVVTQGVAALKGMMGMSDD